MSSLSTKRRRRTTRTSDPFIDAILNCVQIQVVANLINEYRGQHIIIACQYKSAYLTNRNIDKTATTTAPVCYHMVDVTGIETNTQQHKKKALSQHQSGETCCHSQIYENAIEENKLVKKPRQEVHIQPNYPVGTLATYRIGGDRYGYRVTESTAKRMVLRDEPGDRFDQVLTLRKTGQWIPEGYKPRESSGWYSFGYAENYLDPSF